VRLSVLGDGGPAGLISGLLYVCPWMSRRLVFAGEASRLLAMIFGRASLALAADDDARRAVE